MMNLDQGILNYIKDEQKIKNVIKTTETIKIFKTMEIKKTTNCIKTYEFDESIHTVKTKKAYENVKSPKVFENIHYSPNKTMQTELEIRCDLKSNDNKTEYAVHSYAALKG